MYVKRNRIEKNHEKKKKYSLCIGLWVGFQFGTNHFAHLNIYICLWLSGGPALPAAKYVTDQTASEVPSTAPGPTTLMVFR
jgi:hypothetical protein